MLEHPAELVVNNEVCTNSRAQPKERYVCSEAESLRGSLISNRTSYNQSLTMPMVIKVCFL